MPSSAAQKKTKAGLLKQEAVREAYVWFWLPGATQPVVAGKLTREGSQLIFNYGQSYLARDDAIPIYLLV